MKQKKLVAQWAFHTSPILGRFHLWIEDVKIEWLRQKDQLKTPLSFVNERTEKMIAMTCAVTALGTKLFGKYGQGAGLEKKELNLVKKEADAISSYAMSESLWYLSRTLPENHAIMVCLGEGLMAKAGETPEMGTNPLIGFGRVYARPEVAQFLESCVLKLINNKSYTWKNFRAATKDITIWGAAIDTLENTSRFAKGKNTGPLTVLHLFDQPLAVTDQYEGYIGNLILPQKIADNAAEESVLIDFFTPRAKVVEAIKLTYPEIKTSNIHVWTLRGKKRYTRIGKIWEEWKEQGVSLVDENWTLPTGLKPFTDSGTYAPTFMVKTWEDEKNETHLFLVDGYAASAEAIQAASLSQVLDLNISLAILSSKFKRSYRQDAASMKLDPDADDFSEKLKQVFKEDNTEESMVKAYQDSIRQARNAGIPLKNRTITVDDLLEQKKWRALSTSGYMLDDPYTGAPGVRLVPGTEDTYEVTVRMTTEKGDKRITFALKLLENFNESKLVFSPLLNRFFKGENFRERGVKISDSGRIKNELKTLCPDALEYSKEKIILKFEKIPTTIFSDENRATLREVLEFYKTNYPIWFEWLEIG